MARRFPPNVHVIRPRQTAVFIVPRARLAAFQEAIRRGVGRGLETAFEPLSANGQGQPTHYVLEVDGIEYGGYCQLVAAADGVKTKFPLVDRHNGRDIVGRRLTFDQVMEKLPLGQRLKKVKEARE